MNLNNVGIEKLGQLNRKSVRKIAGAQHKINRGGRGVVQARIELGHFEDLHKKCEAVVAARINRFFHLNVRRAEVALACTAATATKARSFYRSLEARRQAALRA